MIKLFDRCQAVYDYLHKMVEQCDHYKDLCHLKSDRSFIGSYYTPDESRLYYGMALVFCLSVNIWLSAGLTNCRINFNFTDIIQQVHTIYDTRNGPWRSMNMRKLSQLLIFAFWSFLTSFFSTESL